MAAKKHDDQPLENVEADEFVEEKTEEQTPEPDTQPQQAEVTGGNKFRQLWQWAKTHRKLSIPLAAVLLIAVLCAVPFTRYALAGTVWKQSYTVKVTDLKTKKPVSSATVLLSGKKVLTDNQGKATIKTNSGYASLTIEKKYYKGSKQDVLVPIFKQKKVQEVSIEATGRQVPVVVVNKISKKPVANVKITVEGTESKTDKDGKAILVLPAGKETVEATFSASGYGTFKQSVKVSESETASVTLVPEGWVYFLSNATGKIDVVKTKLDGSDRTVVLEGTGKEDKYATALLASRDWKYLALHSRRDSEKPKLYLIETGTNKITVMDEGDATFTLTGWSDHHFIYEVTRTKVQTWETKRQALKSYDAEAQKITTLDETKAEGPMTGYSYEEMDQAYILENEIVYVKRWYNGGYNGDAAGKQNTLNSAKPDGKAKKVIKAYATKDGQYYNNLSVRSYGAQELYVLNDKSDNNSTIEEYEGGQIKAVSDYTREDFYNASYNTYLISPSGEKTFWTDFRDGSSTFFLGNKEGEGEKKLGSLKEFTAYGWYTDDYLLVAKGGSELYVLSANNPVDDKSPLKVTDYYKAAYDFRGYGYGYGGL